VETSDTNFLPYVPTDSSQNFIRYSQRKCLISVPSRGKPYKKLPFYGLEMNDTTYVVIAIVAALGLLGVVVVVAVMTIPLQQVEAGCEKGLPQSARAFNASQGRCFNP
jgi:hypothetical protein